MASDELPRFFDRNLETLKNAKEGTLYIRYTPVKDLYKDIKGYKYDSFYIRFSLVPVKE